MANQSINPVVKGVSYFLAHVPSMIRHGSKPSWEIQKDSSLLKPILEHLRSFEKAVSYPPNQVFIGNLDPDDLLRIPLPCYKNLSNNSSRWGTFGEIMPEEEFYGMMKICDEFQLLQMEDHFLEDTASKLKNHPLFGPEDLKKLGNGVSPNQIKRTPSEGFAMPLFIRGDQLIAKEVYR